jgi:hypothetical protein
MMASSVRLIRGTTLRLDEGLLQLSRVTIAKTKIEIHLRLLNILLQFRYEHEMIKLNERIDQDGHRHN